MERLRPARFHRRRSHGPKSELPLLRISPETSVPQIRRARQSRPEVRTRPMSRASLRRRRVALVALRVPGSRRAELESPRGRTAKRIDSECEHARSRARQARRVQPRETMRAAHGRDSTPQLQLRAHAGRRASTRLGRDWRAPTWKDSVRPLVGTREPRASRQTPAKDPP